MTHYESLVFEIFSNFVTYLTNGVIESTCQGVINNPNVFISENLPDETLYAKTGTKIFINRSMIIKMVQTTAQYFHKYQTFLSQYDNLENNTRNLTRFICVCLSNEQFMKDFFKNYVKRIN